MNEMKEPIVIYRESPVYTAFTCLTCGERMTQCEWCRRILCSCTNEEWYGVQDCGGSECYICKNHEWPTEDGTPWEFDIDRKSNGNIDILTDPIQCVCGKKMWVLKPHKGSSIQTSYWRCNCGRQVEVGTNIESKWK